MDGLASTITISMNYLCIAAFIIFFGCLGYKIYKARDWRERHEDLLFVASLLLGIGIVSVSVYRGAQWSQERGVEGKWLGLHRVLFEDDDDVAQLAAIKEFINRGYAEQEEPISSRTARKLWSRLEDEERLEARKLLAPFTKPRSKIVFPFEE